MDMLTGEEIAAAGLEDWRKLAQGLHARYLTPGFREGTAFVAAIGELGDAVGEHVHLSLATGYVDLKLVSGDAIYHDESGTDYVVEWVTQRDVDLARQITLLAADRGLRAAPTEVSQVELGVDVSDVAAVAPVWAAILLGKAGADARGATDDEVRDATGRVPNLWFGERQDDSTKQRVHVEVYVAPEEAPARLAAAVAAGGTIVDESGAPDLTVVADPEGNTAVLCIDASAAPASAEQ